MNFEETASKCEWRVIARNEPTCKACINQPNGIECSENNCALWQFAKAILDEMREDLHNVVKTLTEQMEDKLENKRLMADYIHKMV